MGCQIPVTVIAGAGSGKSALLRSLLDQSGSMAPGAVLVLSHPAGLRQSGSTEIITLDQRIATLNGACLCCVVQGELVQALRDRFLAALHRKAPAYSHVFIELVPDQDAASIFYTLRFDAFLRDRYVYNGCITVIDGGSGEHALYDHPQVLRQAVLGDALVISTAQGSGLGRSTPEGLRDSLHGLNPEASIWESDAVQTLAAQVFSAEGLQPAPHGYRSGAWLSGGLFRLGERQTRTAGGLGLQQRAHARTRAGIQVLTVSWKTALDRAAILMAISALQEAFDPGLLRVSGELVFVGDEGCWRVRGIHGQLYPLRRQARPQPPDAPTKKAHDSPRSVLVLIFQGQTGSDIEAAVLSILPIGAELV